MKLTEEELESAEWATVGERLGFAPYTKVAYDFIESKRWSTLHLLVIRDDLTDKLFGFYVEEPATEMQDEPYPYDRNESADEYYFGQPVEPVMTVTYKVAS